MITTTITRNTYVYDALRRALRMRVGRAEQLSTLQSQKPHPSSLCKGCGLRDYQHRWFSGSQKNNTWLVETLEYVLSTFEVLFSSCSLGFYGGLTSWFFSLSESLAVGYIEHSFLHLTPPNTYVAKGQPHCPLHSPLPRIVPPTPSSSSIDVRKY